MEKQENREAKLKLESVEPSELVHVEGGVGPVVVGVILAELFAIGVIGGMILHDVKQTGTLKAISPRPQK